MGIVLPAFCYLLIGIILCRAFRPHPVTMNKLVISVFLAVCVAVASAQFGLGMGGGGGGMLQGGLGGMGMRGSMMQQYMFLRMMCGDNIASMMMSNMMANMMGGG